jgi:O-antigen ligase
MAFALAAPVSIAVAEPLAYLAVLLLVVRQAAGLFGKRPGARPGDETVANPYVWPILLFVGAVFLASWYGIRPMHSFRKMDRLFLLGLVFALPLAFPPEGLNRWETVRRLCMLFVAGSCIKALYDVLHIPLALWMAEPPPPGVEEEMPLLYRLGNMREPQMYMVALCFVVGALVHGVWRERRWLLWLALALLVAAFVLHFKRGAWLAFGLTAVLLAVVAGNRRLLAALGVCMVLLMFMPQVRTRMEMVRNEFSFKFGGRMLLWVHSAPKLIIEHPMGMGWRAVRHADLKATSRYVYPGLNHVHNNALQVTVELGWAGLAAWLNWMGMGLYVMWDNVRRARKTDAMAAAAALGTLGAFCALLFNGVVEYNFGDGEIFMVLAFLMGLSVVLRNALRHAVQPAPP